MKRYMRYFAIFAVLGLVLAACSPADEGEGSTTTEAAEGTTTTEAAMGRPRPVRPMGTTTTAPRRWRRWSLVW